MSKAFRCEHRLVHLDKYFVSPLETGIRNFNSIVNYYMYYAPNIDSKHSSGKIEGDRAKETLDRMIDIAGMKNRYVFYVKKSVKPWEEFKLNQNDICIDCCRFICKKRTKQEELTALLGHIRNSFAHGLIYVKNEKQTKRILLEDYDSRNKETSARIVLTAKILEDWKAILENVIATGE